MNRSPMPPRIADLTAGHLGRLDDAEVLANAADAYGEVQPHEVAVGFRAEPRVAWNAALEALTAFGRPTVSIPAPADWGSLVVRQEAVAALPFALGNYPQRVRDLGTLFQTANLQDLLPKSIESAPASMGLIKWGTKHVESGELPHALVASANYRAARDFDRAAEVLKSAPRSAEWQAIVANEEAALLWHRGEYVQADAAWAKLPDSVPVRFNRGLCALFLGRPNEAKAHLQSAVAGLPETNAWHHLASLYLTLAGLR